MCTEGADSALGPRRPRHDALHPSFERVAFTRDFLGVDKVMMPAARWLTGRAPEKRCPSSGWQDPKEPRRDGGVSMNRSCACCGIVMEQNEPRSPVTPREYCYICGREPLCAVCSNFIFGGPSLYDVRWGMLTYRAARANPRTAATAERVELVICCRCRGGIEHRPEEQPLAIGPWRPEGWRLCTRCSITRIMQRDGRTIWRYSCPEQWRHHTWDGKGQTIALRTPWSHDGVLDSSMLARLDACVLTLSRRRRAELWPVGGDEG
ncbi:hypothetical protein N9L68_02020 [bacterium]|nr:hypothetical protein [bacterium]